MSSRDQEGSGMFKFLVLSSGRGDKAPCAGPVIEN